MRAERFGSYSSVATLAGTASLPRLKSMMRYILRVPPPLWRTSISDFSGSTLLRSEKSIVVTKRLPGLVGLYFLTGIRVQPRGRAYDACESLLEVVDAAELDLLT